MFYSEKKPIFQSQSKQKVAQSKHVLAKKIGKESNLIHFQIVTIAEDFRIHLSKINEKIRPN